MASLGIGIWAGWMAKRNTGGDAKAAASEFLMGGRKMNPFAVAMSTMIGAISSVTVVGEFWKWEKNLFSLSFFSVFEVTVVGEFLKMF